MKVRNAIPAVIILAGWTGVLPATAAEWRGFVAAEYRGFWESPTDPEQYDHFPSLVAQPEWYSGWAEGRQAVSAVPFFRWDPYDPERTHADLREAYWMVSGSDFDLRIGFNKVFWGATESQHLVDIVNQTDLVENPDGEEKLGQPMIGLTTFKDWGNLEVVLLPYFRERTFPGLHGRLRSIPWVDPDADAVYQSRRKEWHGDAAVRWSRSIGSWDVGLSYFYGTGREPLLLSAVDGSGEPILVPYYFVMHQGGLDVQGVLGAWLWKLEAAYRSAPGDDFTALTGGFEYTFYGLFGGAVDIGMVAEYLYDDRGGKATTPFENDWMAGMRLSPNDVQGTEFLAAVIWDPESGASFFSLEASRRLTGHLKAELESRIFSGLDSSDPFYGFRHDDYIQVTAAYYF